MNAQPKRRPGRPATGKTPVRSFRMGPIYDEAETVAGAKGEAIRDVIERLLAQYVHDPDCGCQVTAVARR